MLRKLLIFAAIAMLFLGVQAKTASADYNLVTNGNFSTGNFTGWSFSNPNNTAAFVMAIAPQSYVPGGPTGNEAQLGTNGLGTTTSIYQSLATTAGTTYNVVFWLANDDPTELSSFQTLWNGNAENLTRLTNNGSLPNGTYSNAFDYNEFEFTATAIGASTALAFAFQNDNGLYHLTDVSATTPIPAAVWLFGSGLMGLIALKRKYLV